ncbi:hypothetical protein HDV00_006009 [Rhizophlyctis rosea]|nr:hypothetical protein HDV00_006009 [Rhizophlyctis rosea]
MYNLYWQAFEKFRAIPPITTLAENTEFCDTVQHMLDAHLIAIPQLAMGIAEAAPQHMHPKQADRFMNEMLRSRVGRRVLAEQHIALSAVFEGRRAQEEGWIGIVNTRCVAEDIVARCIELAKDVFRETFGDQGLEPPDVVVDGQLGATFVYIPDHIEYIIFELLKNSMYATVKTHAPEAVGLDGRGTKAAAETEDRTREPQSNGKGLSEEAMVVATHGAAKSATGVASSQSSQPSPTSHHQNQPPSPPPTTTTLPPIRLTIGSAESTIMFRVSDQGGGISKQTLSHIWSFSHPSKLKFSAFANYPRLAAKVEERVPLNMGLGLGLPMSKVYAEYWGGMVEISGMEGFGTDVYLSVGVGNQSENLKYDDL